MSTNRICSKSFINKNLQRLPLEFRITSAPKSIEIIKFQINNNSTSL